MSTRLTAKHSALFFCPREEGKSFLGRASSRCSRICKLPTKSSLDAEISLRDRMIQRRAHFHDLPRLRVNRKFAAHTAIRTNRVGLRLLSFIPGPHRPPLVLGLEHQCARGAHTDAIAAINARRFRQRNIELRGNMRGKASPRNADRKRILRIHSASLHTLVAK